MVASMEDSRLTSLSLIDGLLANDVVYWQRFDSLYGPIIDFWLKRAKVPVSNIPDVRQEVMLAISQNFSSYNHSLDEHGSLRRWMWGTARNKIADHWRKLEKQVAVADESYVLKQFYLPSDPFEDSEPATLRQLRNCLLYTSPSPRD